MPHPTPPHTPTVTIVIPCFNHGRFIAQAVASCLAQVDADVRVVIVDDGSDDGTTAQLCDAQTGERVTVIHQANRGLPAARNRGAAEVTGGEGGEGEVASEFIAFLDADDWIEPTFVSKLARAIREADAPEVSHAYCQEQLVELGEGVWRVPEWDAELMLITNLHPVTALLRRECFEQLGGFDETMTRGYEDWELWIRCVERGWRGVRVREPLFVWRRHSEITMVIEAVSRHEELVASIIERHRALYESRFEALYARCNSMLRRFDCNWLDESGDPISLRHLKDAHASIPVLYEQLAAAREERDAWRTKAEASDAAYQQLHADYERMTVIRLHHRVHGVIRALPGPVRAIVGFPVRVLRGLAGTRSSTDNQP